MGIVIGEHRLIKEERRVGEKLLGTVLLGRTHKLIHIHTHILYVHTETHTHKHYFRHQRLPAIMCYGVGGRYGRMAFLIKTIRSLIALGFHLILRH